MSDKQKKHVFICPSFVYGTYQVLIIKETTACWALSVTCGEFHSKPQIKWTIIALFGA